MKDTDEQKAIEQAVGQPVVAVCRFSPGPWWGFNGVQTLALTDDDLVAFQRSIAITAQAAITEMARSTLPLSSIRSVSTKSRKGFLSTNRMLTIKLSTEHGRKIYTTKHFVDGNQFVAALKARR